MTRPRTRRPTKKRTPARRPPRRVVLLEAEVHALWRVVSTLRPDPVAGAYAVHQDIDRLKQQVAELLTRTDALTAEMATVTVGRRSSKAVR